MVGLRLSKALKFGRLRWLGKPLYEGLIATELAWIRGRERKRLPFASTPLVVSELTAIIKTFERPKTLKRLIDSIERCYPNLRVIIADDSRTPSFFEGMRTIALSYDSGVSLGRQRALEAVETPYVLLLDDDFIFYGKTKLEAALRRMKKNPLIDIMGGEVVNLPSFKAAEYKNARLYPTESQSLIQPGTLIDGMPVYDKVPNFYIARTERLKLVGWDRRIKRLDHADFFTRAKGTLVSVVNRQLKVLHAQTPHNRSYMLKRYDLKQDRAILKMKYYWKV